MKDTMNNYVLGRGELHFAQYLPGTRKPTGERYFGNTPEFSCSAEQETLQHYNSDHGVKVKDASVILQLDYTSSFITDNISPENLALFFLGESFKETTDAETGLTSKFDEIRLGHSYQLGTSDDNPSGLRMVENVEITAPAGATAGTDFVVDKERGRITLMEDSANLTEGDELEITFDTLESTRTRVVSKASEIEGSLRFLSYNATGDEVDFYMPWVKLTPDGDFALKGDEWQQIPFSVEILKKGALSAVYMDGKAFEIPAGP